ncbi:hypothetical protein [Pseudooceanicola atlanticus]|nr:hypothetical protein [Pseudooceanicola atlanticus]
MTSFEGKISAADFEQDIAFVAYAGDDCRLIVGPIQVSGEAYVALSKCMGRPGSHAGSITLTGESADGSKFSSPHMEIRGLQSGSEGHEIRLGTGEASITVPRKVTSKEPTVALKLALRGFKSFRPSPVQAQLGRVVVQGANKVMSSDDVSGAIFVEFSGERPSDSWYHDAEALAEFVWKGLQFGHGGRLQIALLEVYRPEDVIATFYNGGGRPAHLPAIHFLDQSEFVAALVARFECEDTFPDAVWQAVGWLNNDSSIDEVRYLTLMTAIETILHSLVPDASSTLLRKTKFKPIRDALIQALATFGLNHDERDVLVSNIKQINRAPLSQKINAVIEKYGLPSDVFNQSLIRRLNKQRVSIVHQGKSLDDDNLWECMLYAREMIALIVFSELRYKGRYQSYAEGHEQRTLA